MNKRLIAMIGMNQYNRYLNFAFEYACQEAEFLKLRESCMSDRIYEVAFENLCALRRRVFLDEIQEAMEEIVDSSGLEIARSIELEFLPYDRIPELIKKRYEGK